MTKKIAILGSTGSIGRQAIDVIGQHNDRYEAYILTAYNNADLLIKQARAINPEAVVIANEEHYKKVKDSLADLPIKVYTGAKSLCEVVEDSNVDIVLGSMVGFAGLQPTISAIKAGKTIALANKETLVVAGELIKSLAREHKVPILPVDSEHSAIFQCLEPYNNIDKILLTCSGGPFRNYSEEELNGVTKDMALAHPTWNMGAKITIDSATLMNKGFEVIEAKWLFDVNPEQIQVVIHPQSVIHSMVQFDDGAVKAQLGMPDMRLPIQYAFSYPYRLKSDFPTLDFFALKDLTFSRPDTGKFRCLALAYEALHTGGNMPCIVNAANEVANQAFRDDRISFPAISETIEKTMSKATFSKECTLEAYLQTDKEARAIANEFIK
jgi:1-deoxy-D-xylulose-5-phosphate reductoisomerase